MHDNPLCPDPADDPENTMRPLYIFDLDGTLALTEHRQHLVQRDKPDWKAFFAACVDDVPNWPVVSVLRGLLDAGADVMIWSGRSAEVMEQTRTWLQRFLEEGHEGVGLVVIVMALHQIVAPREV